MQKVSKQSLAMLALSILLAISIALTFTFAGLTAQKTASGEITFQGNVAITLGAGFSSDKLSITTNGSGALAIPDNATIGLAAGSVAAHMKITVGAPTGANASAVTISSKETVASGWNKSSTDTIYVTVGNKIQAEGSVKLSDLIQISVNLDELKDATPVTFNISIDASATSAYTVE